jgi:FAD-dependent oxidoreductase domain-containing protein 1
MDETRDHRCDIAIIGGSVIGSAVAYFLLRSGKAGRVLVIEPDPSYEYAAAPRASGNIRQLWGLPENIEMAKFSREFYVRFPQEIATPGDLQPSVGWNERGYLWLAPPEGIPLLERNYKNQQALGLETAILAPAEIGKRFPSITIDGIGAGAWSPTDGWLDGYLAVQGLRKKARILGATYLRDRAMEVLTHANRATAVALASGGKVKAEVIVVAAGAWGPAIAETVGMKLPVVPVRRMKFYFETPNTIEPLPMVRDFPRLTMRPEGQGYFAGVSSLADPPGFNFNVDHDFFEEAVWPALAARFKAFETLKVRNSWAGHYEQNLLDTCLILGRWPAHYDNFLVITGFSGNGLMHGPAAARGLSELILDGRFTTIDLSRMGYQRVLDNEPLHENIVI